AWDRGPVRWDRGRGPGRGSDGLAVLPVFDGTPVRLRPPSGPDPPRPDPRDRGGPVLWSLVRVPPRWSRSRGPPGGPAPGGPPGGTRRTLGVRTRSRTMDNRCVDNQCTCMDNRCMAGQRLPRRKVLSHGERRVVHRRSTRYGFKVDVLSCGHEIYWDSERPATRGCWDCRDGRPPGFHPKELR